MAVGAVKAHGKAELAAHLTAHHTRAGALGAAEALVGAVRKRLVDIDPEQNPEEELHVGVLAAGGVQGRFVLTTFLGSGACQANICGQNSRAMDKFTYLRLVVVAIVAGAGQRHA